MTTRVLGISALYHDAAAALVVDGRIVAAAQEERFSRRKHDPRFPLQAINYCLEEGGIDIADIDGIAYHDDPVLTWDRVVRGCIAAGEPSRKQFEAAARTILGSKLWIQRLTRDLLGGLGAAGSLLTAGHHKAHAASAFYPSPFDRAAILTVDGVGEWATTTIGLGEGSEIELLREIEYPHSLGLLYSAVTQFCGFAVNDGEYKLMGLAPFGEPRYAPLILDRLICLGEDGAFRLNTGYFGFLDGLEMTNARFAELFGGPARLPESRITRRERDMAASIQCVLDEAVLRLARTAKRETGARHLVMAGGVALNCVSNGKLLRAGLFDGLWIQPAAGDAGGAVGAALLAAHTHFRVPRPPIAGRRDGQNGSFLGPAFGGEEVRALLDRHGLPHHVCADDAARAAIVASALAEGKVVGVLRGRMEFGPRALGARSILGDPRDPAMQQAMNVAIKNRESFRPFAPAVRRERAAEYFDLEGESPYMLLVAPVRAERRLPQPPEILDADDLVATIGMARSDVPAVTHVDYSARVQTVDARDNPDLHALLTAFEALTGCGVLVNTSFNVRDEPIVCSPRHAYACFMRTRMDLLVLEDCLLWKSEQPPVGTPIPMLAELEATVRLLADEFDRALAEEGMAERVAAEIADLFETTILPLHELAAARGIRPLDDAPAAPPRFIARAETERRRGVRGWTVAAYDDEHGLAEALRSLWERETDLPLAEASARHARTARILADALPPETADVATSLYAMF